MAIKIVKSPELKKLIGAVGKTNQLLASLAQFIITGVSNRTQKGIDFNNRTFKSYNAKYKAFRTSKGRSARVNLTFNNQMLNAMRFKKINSGVMIHFPDSVENTKAYYNHEEQGREFFGLDSNQERYIMNSIRDYISRNLK